jgi:hypothetical protein
MGGAAKGMPRNLLTVFVEDGTEVAVPTTTPALIVAVGWAYAVVELTADAKGTMTSTASEKVGNIMVTE